MSLLQVLIPNHIETNMDDSTKLNQFLAHLFLLNDLKANRASTSLTIKLNENLPLDISQFGFVIQKSNMQYTFPKKYIFNNP